MQSPIREKLRINDRWHARQLTEKAARIFVPGPWANRRVVLTPDVGTNWSAAHIGEQALGRDPQSAGWEAGAGLAAGEWHTITTEDGALGGAHLTASSVLHISDLEATSVSERSLLVRIRLAGHEHQAEITGPASLGGRLLSLFFSLTGPDGNQVGALEVTVAPKTRGLSIEMPLSRPLEGLFRLKASLCSSETVIDNARIDVNL